MNIQLFGPKTFPVVQGYKGAVNTFLSGLTSPIVAMLIVSIGYSATYMIGGFIWIVPVVIYLIVNKFFIGKMPWVDGDGNPMPQADAIRAQKAAGAK
jgi:hypothetical protein